MILLHWKNSIFIRLFIYHKTLITFDVKNIVVLRLKEINMVLQNSVWASSFKLWSFFKISPNQTRGHGFKLYKQFSSTTVRSSFFAQRVVNVWNSLPTSVDFSTLSAFNWSLQRVNLNEFFTVYKFSDVYDCV